MNEERSGIGYPLPESAGNPIRQALVTTFQTIVNSGPNAAIDLLAGGDSLLENLMRRVVAGRGDSFGREKETAFDLVLVKALYSCDSPAVLALDGVRGEFQPCVHSMPQIDRFVEATRWSVRVAHGDPVI